MSYHPTPDLLLELKGYRLTTAEIIYCLPDYPELLQTFIWQSLDISPDFPRLQTFLIFWENALIGFLLFFNFLDEFPKYCLVLFRDVFLLIFAINHYEK